MYGDLFFWNVVGCYFFFMIYVEVDLYGVVNGN